MAPRRRSLAERFAARVEMLPDAPGCWLWVGCKSKGYGALCAGGHSGPMLAAHRVSYELFVGPIPAGLVIDHKCRTTECVRPDHLRAVTQRVNVETNRHDPDTGRFVRMGEVRP